MSNDQLLVAFCAFGAVSLLAFWVIRVLAGKITDTKLRTRLTARGMDAGVPSAAQQSRVKELLARVGHAAAQPFMPSDANKQVVIRRSLARAGIYTPSAIRLVTGAKVIFLALGMVLGYAAAGYMIDDPIYQLAFGLSMGGLIGYLFPTIWLRAKTNANQLALTNGLADALDLMVVCVEAGLTIDSAMQRVGQELALAHQALSREMGMTHMETRVGLPRSEALRNMGLRTGNSALQGMAAMLIQADRFGTSIADALRIHSESLRINRQMIAEETAGKASVKLSFPLVLCIFPATFIVLAGPTVINLMNSSLFK